MLNSRIMNPALGLTVAAALMGAPTANAQMVVATDLIFGNVASSMIPAFQSYQLTHGMDYTASLPLVITGNANVEKEIIDGSFRPDVFLSSDPAEPEDLQKN